MHDVRNITGKLSFQFLEIRNTPPLNNNNSEYRLIGIQRQKDIERQIKIDITLYI